MLEWDKVIRFLLGRPDALEGDRWEQHISALRKSIEVRQVELENSISEYQVWKARRRFFESFDEEEREPGIVLPVPWEDLDWYDRSTGRKV